VGGGGGGGGARFSDYEVIKKTGANGCLLNSNNRANIGVFHTSFVLMKNP
jgi:hypothetical protein